MRNLEFWLHSEYGMRGIMAPAHAPNNSWSLFSEVYRKRLFWPGFPDLAIPGLRVRKWRNPPHFSIKEMGNFILITAFPGNDDLASFCFTQNLWGQIFLRTRVAILTIHTVHWQRTISELFFIYSPGVNSNWLNDFFDDVFWLLFAEEKTNSRKTHQFCSTNKL
jgi:hypothetical protein